MEVTMRDLYCYECSLQFDTKNVFDVHLSVVHSKKIDTKQESESQPSVVPETKDVKISHPDEETTWKNESQGGEVSIKTALIHEKQFKCDVCFKKFANKGYLKNHVASVHEGKKTFKCEFCNHTFSQKINLKSHVASIHEGKKPFKCEFCNYTCSTNQVLKIHWDKKISDRLPYLPYKMTIF